MNESPHQNEWVVSKKPKRRLRRILIAFLLVLPIIVVVGYFVGMGYARSKIEEAMLSVTAARGLSVQWEELEFSLSGRIVLRGIQFESTSGGTFNGEVERIETVVPLRDLWERRRPDDFLIYGITLRADLEGIRALRGSTRSDDGSVSTGSGRTPIRADLRDSDFLVHLGGDVSVGCHVDQLTADAGDSVDVRGRMVCRVPEFSIDTGMFTAVALFDRELGEEPLQLVLEPDESIRTRVAGATFGRVSVSAGRMSGQIEIGDLTLAPDLSTAGLAVEPTLVALSNLRLVIQNRVDGWHADRLEVASGEIRVALGGQSSEDTERVDPLLTSDDERMNLEEATSELERVGYSAPDWEGIEANMTRATELADSAMSLATEWADRIEINDLSIIVEVRDMGDVPLVIQQLVAVPGSAVASGNLAGNELQAEIRRLEQSEDGDAPRFELSASLDGLDIGSISEQLGRPGLFAGHFDIQLDLLTGEGVELDLTVDVPDFAFNHAAVSPAPLELLPLQTTTHLVFSPGQEEPLSIRIDSELGEEVQGYILFDVTTEDGEQELETVFHIDEVRCRHLLEAIPAGLFQHLNRDDIEIAGRTALDGDFRYVFGNHRTFRMRFSEEEGAFPGTCRITEMPDGFHPQELLEDDYRHQVSPEFLDLELDPELEIWVGPGTESWVDLDDLPDYVPAIMYLTEQSRFYEEPPVSIRLINRAIRVNLIYGRWAYGGSTIAQQLVKNVFLERVKTLARKFEEILLAWAVDSFLTRDQIIEMYVNCIEFGPNVWGIEAAAQYYFGIPAPQLSAAQASYIAGLKMHPSSGGDHRRDDHTPDRERWTSRIQSYLERLVEAGFIEPSYVESQAPYILPFGPPENGIVLPFVGIEP